MALRHELSAESVHGSCSCMCTNKNALKFFQDYVIICLTFQQLASYFAFFLLASDSWQILNIDKAVSVSFLMTYNIFEVIKKVLYVLS